MTSSTAYRQAFWIYRQSRVAAAENEIVLCGCGHPHSLYYYVHMNKDLTQLGQSKTDYPQSPEEATLETFENTHSAREYVIAFDCPEFTSICPITGQPDFGHIEIEYIADTRCIESKSLKLYLFAYRNHGAFHEEVVNLILDDLVKACSPKVMTVRGKFNPRGGIAIEVEATHTATA